MDLLANKRKSAKQASMADVALRAGVSLITVSRFMREPERVSGSTRIKIRQAMDDLGYIPNLIAGGLATTRSHTVAAVVPYISHGVFSDAIQGLSDFLNKKGYQVLLGNSGDSNETNVIRTLLSYRPAGIVIQGAVRRQETRQLLLKSGMPIVEIGTLPDFPIDMAVGYSNKAAAKDMTERLVINGRRRIGLITSNPKANDRQEERLLGYKDALLKWNISYDPLLVIDKGYGIAEGRIAFRLLLSRYKDLDAVFCGSDLWAAGVIFECQRCGINVPDDIAVCGFNNQEIASEINPPITTIGVRRYEIGATSAELITKRLDGGFPDKIIDVGFDLISRKSG